MAAKLRNKFLLLLTQKEQKEDRRIRTSEIAQHTGISVPTVHRWLRNEVDKIEGPVLIAFCEYFNCDLCDLLYIDRTIE
ncbi:MAG: helix-turn-helix transcriptional regulator [bacterium]|nr:helix-turn-helix transcriptional regulator [bacterium]